MKKIIVVLFLAVLAFSSAEAQSARDRETIRIESNIQCQACQDLIERYFKRVPGIINMRVNYRTNLINITYKPSRLTPSMLRTNIANLGFDADTIKANPDFAKRLPPCCRPEGVEADKMERLEEKAAEEEGK